MGAGAEMEACLACWFGFVSCEGQISQILKGRDFFGCLKRPSRLPAYLVGVRVFGLVLGRQVEAHEQHLEVAQAVLPHHLGQEGQGGNREDQTLWRVETGRVISISLPSWFTPLMYLNRRRNMIDAGVFWNLVENSIL